MKQKTCKVAKTVLTLLLCAGLTAGSVPIDALAAMYSQNSLLGAQRLIQKPEQKAIRNPQVLYLMET